MIFPLRTFVTFYAEKERIKALNASTVKIKANDVLASIKCLAYMITFPVYLLLTTLIFRHFLRRYWLVARSDSWLMALVFFVIFPTFQLISMRSHDGVKTHGAEFQGRFLSLFYSDQVNIIKTTRKTLKKKIREAVDNIGPKIFKNFDKMRLIMFNPEKGHQITKMRRSKSDYKNPKWQINSDNKSQERGPETLSTRDQKEDDLFTKNSDHSGANLLFPYNNPDTEYDLDLDYLDELELEKAFNIFKDIL